MSPTNTAFGTICAALLVDLVRPDREAAAIGYYDPQWRLLGRRHLVGGASRMAIPVRTVVAEAIGFDAVAVVIAHSHPSGDPRPSAADFAFTRQLARTLTAVDVRLADHLIVATDGVVSLRALGVL